MEGERDRERQRESQTDKEKQRKETPGDSRETERLTLIIAFSHLSSPLNLTLFSSHSFVSVMVISSLPPTPC